MNKYFIPLIIFILCAACEPQEQSIKSITLNLQEGDPPSLNPSIGVDLRSRCLLLALFEPLMRRTADSLQPAAASAVEVDDTKTIYTFHIRPHLWSNGVPVTAYHFAQAWRYALKPDSCCFRADLFYPIKNAMQVRKGELPIESLGIETPDPSTLIITLEHPTPYFLDLTATSFFSPLYDPSSSEPLHFNGPFIIKQRVPDRLLILKKNPQYWDLDSIEIEQINFTMVKDPMTAFAMFAKGELDLVGDPFSTLPLDAIPQLESSGSLQKKTISRIFYLLLNTESFPLNVKSLRKALALSIDRKELTQQLLFGELPTLSALPTTLSFLNDQQTYLEDENPSLLFEKALQEMNLSKETFPKIVLNYAELSGQKKLAEFIQAQWKKTLGINIDIVCQEWNVHSSHLKTGHYQMATLHLTTLYQDPMFYFDLFRSKKSLCNYCRWEDESFKRLLDQSEHTSSLCERNSYLRQAECYLLDEMPVISLYTQNLQFLTHDRIELDISELGTYDFKNARFR